jgi:hypothetical protein
MMRRSFLLPILRACQTPRLPLLAQRATRRHASHRHDARHHLFLSYLVRDRQHRHLRDGLVGMETRFHLGSRDVLTRAPDDVLLSVDEYQHAVRHLAHGVARVEPAAAPGLRRRPIRAFVSTTLR